MNEETEVSQLRPLYQRTLHREEGPPVPSSEGGEGPRLPVLPHFHNPCLPSKRSEEFEGSELDLLRDGGLSVIPLPVPTLIQSGSYTGTNPIPRNVVKDDT